MTIAMGMLCAGGAIVAADTKVVLGDHSTTEGEKIVMTPTLSGAVAIADSSWDANATKTLVRNLKVACEQSDFKTWDDLETTISCYMTDWSNSYGQRNPPESSLVIAAAIKGLGVKLYFCEPPAAIVPCLRDCYVGAGDGSAVTDTLYKGLFESRAFMHYDPQRVMRIIAYLMYRAKKDRAAYCGGRTQAIYVRSDGERPEWIRSIDFETAETQSHKLDFLLRATAQFALLSTPGANLETNATGIRDMLIGLAGLRAVTFCGLTGEPITESSEHNPDS